MFQRRMSGGDMREECKTCCLLSNRPFPRHPEQSAAGASSRGRHSRPHRCLSTTHLTVLCSGVDKRRYVCSRYFCKCSVSETLVVRLSAVRAVMVTV